MCVIAVINKDDKRPTVEEVKAMWDTNPSGGGAAWREGGKVKWDKGLDLDKMQQYNQELSAPYVLHFRIPSIGGPTKLLTHPFPIDPAVPLDLQGETSVGVLFHNGTLNNWEVLRRDWTKPGLMEFPGGPWSDSRTMAYLIAHYCPKKFGFLDNVLSAEKILIFTPDMIKIGGPTGENGRSWTLWDNRYMVSNDFFDFRLPHRAKHLNYYQGPARLQGNQHPGGSKSQDETNDKEEPHESSETQLAEGYLITTPKRREIPSNLMLIGGAPEVKETAPFVEAMVRYCRHELSKKALKRAHRRYSQAVMQAVQAQGIQAS